MADDEVSLVDIVLLCALLLLLKAADVIFGIKPRQPKEYEYYIEPAGGRHFRWKRSPKQKEQNGLHAS